MTDNDFPTNGNGNGSFNWPFETPEAVTLQFSTGYEIDLDFENADKTFQELGNALIGEVFLPTFRRHAKHKHGLKNAIGKVHDEITGLVKGLNDSGAQKVLHLAMWHFFCERYKAVERRVKKRKRRR
jgi:hypothetical protein